MKRPYLLSILSLTIFGILISCNQIKFKQTTENNSSLVTASPTEIIEKTELRPLSGQLDTVPMFNSNSPEWIKKEGILLSTFPRLVKVFLMPI